MANSFSKKRPRFDVFRDLFLNMLEREMGEKPDTSVNWLELGDEVDRSVLLARFKDKLVENYDTGKKLEIRSELVNLDGPVESVITQLFHIYSTLFLVEHINESITGRKEEDEYKNN